MVYANTILQITVGKANKRRTKKKNESTISNPPTDQTRPVRSNQCSEGDFVALRLNKYDDEIPQIGRVMKVDESDVTIEWWVGIYSSPWICWKQRGEPVEETFTKNAVIYRVKFTKSMRISSELKADLKQIYENTELI